MQAHQMYNIHMNDIPLKVGGRTLRMTRKPVNLFLSNLRKSSLSAYDDTSIIKQGKKITIITIEVEQVIFNILTAI